MRDLYSVLNLSRRASSKDIKAAYWALAKQLPSGSWGVGSGGSGHEFPPSAGVRNRWTILQQALEIAVAAAR
jgi:hypothetical protein